MSSRITFQNPYGETLSAHLDLPVDGAPVAYALFFHCFTPTEGLDAADNISLALTEAGLAVLRFDVAQPGTNEETTAHPGLRSEDLIAAARHLEQIYHAPQILIGHSVGGAAALATARDLPSVRAVAVVNAPSNTNHIKNLLASTGPNPETLPTAQPAGRSLSLSTTLLEQLEPERMQASIRGLERALLIMHAPQDNFVSIDSAAELFLAARHPKSFVSLDRADHLLTDPHDSRYVGNVIASWAHRYVQPHAQPSWKDDVHDNRVAVRTEKTLRTEMMANGFSLVADEPASLGGTDTGPTPYDYLAAALGACTSMTLRMYADRKGWPLDAVTVTIKHSKVHVQDCLDCEKSKAKLDHFERTLTLEGDLDEAQRARLLEIAERCPVHRTLESKVQITSRLKEHEAA